MRTYISITSFIISLDNLANAHTIRAMNLCGLANKKKKKTNIIFQLISHNYANLYKKREEGGGGKKRTL